MSNFHSYQSKWRSGWTTQALVNSSTVKARPAADLRRQFAATLAGSVRYKRYPNLPGSDQALLAAFGERVVSRLKTIRGISRIPAVNVDMFMMREFMSAEECAQMVELINEDAKPSVMVTDHGNDGFRTSQTCKMSNAHPLVSCVQRRIIDLLGLPINHAEPLQGQRYQTGQRFKMHNDYFAGGQSYSQAVAEEGGQRTWTAMVFLNQVDAGGCTNFPRALVKVAPVAGALLTWNNNDRQGLSNPFTDHEGMPVESGTKYILTQWFREREWQWTERSDALRV